MTPTRGLRIASRRIRGRFSNRAHVSIFKMIPRSAVAQFFERIVRVPPTSSSLRTKENPSTSACVAMNLSVSRSPVVNEATGRLHPGTLIPFSGPSFSPSSGACVISTRTSSGSTAEMVPPIFPSSSQIASPALTQSKNSKRLTPIQAGLAISPLLSSSAGRPGSRGASQDQSIAAA